MKWIMLIIKVITSPSSQDKITGTEFIFPPEKNYKTQVKYTKQQFSRHWTFGNKRVIPERWDATVASSLLPWERLLAIEERENVGRAKESLKCGDSVKSPERPGQPVFSGQSTREERAIEIKHFKALSRVSLEYSAEHWSARAYKEITWGQQKNMIWNSACSH